MQEFGVGAKSFIFLKQKKGGLYVQYSGMLVILMLFSSKIFAHRLAILYTFMSKNSLLPFCIWYSIYIMLYTLLLHCTRINAPRNILLRLITCRWCRTVDHLPTSLKEDAYASDDCSWACINRWLIIYTL